MKRRFKKVEDGGSGTWTWLSEKITHGDWPFRFAIVIEDTREWGNSVGFYYHASIYAVSPKACQKKWSGPAVNLGISVEDFGKLPHLAQCQAIMDYGIKAVLWQETGDKVKALLQQAREKMLEVDGLFGFFMDRPQNAIGDTGWDWIAGNLCAKLKKKENEDD